MISSMETFTIKDNLQLYTKMRSKVAVKFIDFNYM